MCVVRINDRERVIKERSCHYRLTYTSTIPLRAAGECFFSLQFP